jgi:TusA-related sulfurtransferase
MKPGETLRVLIDDRATADNIRLAVEQLGDTILSFQQKEKEFIVIIQKSERGYKSALKMKLSS